MTKFWEMDVSTSDAISGLCLDSERMGHVGPGTVGVQGRQSYVTEDTHFPNP